jgi:hypothetical protein
MSPYLLEGISEGDASGTVLLPTPICRDCSSARLLSYGSTIPLRALGCSSARLLSYGTTPGTSVSFS